MHGIARTSRRQLKREGLICPREACEIFAARFGYSFSGEFIHGLFDEGLAGVRLESVLAPLPLPKILRHRGGDCGEISWTSAAAIERFLMRFFEATGTDDSSFFTYLIRLDYGGQP
jgi:hypothetical protein